MLGRPWLKRALDARRTEAQGVLAHERVGAARGIFDEERGRLGSGAEEHGRAQVDRHVERVARPRRDQRIASRLEPPRVVREPGCGSPWPGLHTGPPPAHVHAHAVDQHDESGGWVWTRRVATAESGRAGSGRSVEPARATSGAAAGASAPADQGNESADWVRPSLGGRTGSEVEPEIELPLPTRLEGVEIGAPRDVIAKNHVPPRLMRRPNRRSPWGADLLELLQRSRIGEHRSLRRGSSPRGIQNQAVEERGSGTRRSRDRCGFADARRP